MSQPNEEELHQGAYAVCPACGDPMDYCRGHGPLGDPEGYETLKNHDAGIHSTCDPAGCYLAGDH